MSGLGEQSSQGQDRKSLLAQQLEALGDEPHFAASEDAAPQQETKPEPSTTDARPRDEAGKFVAKDTKAVKVNESEGSPVASAAPAETAPAAEPPLWERPPASWNKRQDLLDPWKSADQKLREMVWTREQQMNEGVMPLKEKAKLADAINEVAAPYMNTIRGLGVDLPKAVQGLMYADNVLRTAPRDQAKAYLMQLAQTYGIDLGQPQQTYDGLGNPQQAPQLDPIIHSLRNEITSIKGEVKSWQQRQEEAAEAQRVAEINKFKLKAEFFDEALPTMTKLAQGGFSDDIEELYNAAIRLDENLSGQIKQRQQAQASATQREAADKAAKAAKAAAVSVKTSTPGVQTATKAQDRRALLEEQFSNSDARL